VVHSAESSPEILAETRPFAVCAELARPGPAPDDWRAFCDWLTPVIPAAVLHGEFVVLERGGWDHQSEPFSLAICAPAESGWKVHIEVVPPPPEGGAWPKRSYRIQEGATVSAPATVESLRGAAVLLVDAAIHWAKSPLDVAITFGLSPHGPYQPEAGKQR
jgi:hypothetical protein